MKTILSLIMMFLAIMLTFSITAQTITTFEFDTINWVLPENYQIGEFEGKQALLIENIDNPDARDPYAYLKDYEFSDGIIEFDLFSPDNYAYIGFLFRLNQHNGEDRFELFYFRPFESSIQYIPVNNGVAIWQYYTDYVYKSSGKTPYNEWAHIKAEINGPKAVVFLNDQEVMTVNNLGRGMSKGSVGIWMDCTTPKCYYANFKITK